jgi:hypothetical protein
LVCWSVGLLVCWSVGLLVCWSVGLLVCWSVGLLVCWSVGLLVSGVGCRVSGVGCRVPGVGCRVPGAGCRVGSRGGWRVPGGAMPVVVSQISNLDPASPAPHPRPPVGCPMSHVSFEVLGDWSAVLSRRFCPSRYDETICTRTPVRLNWWGDRAADRRVRVGLRPLS